MSTANDNEMPPKPAADEPTTSSSTSTSTTTTAATITPMGPPPPKNSNPVYPSNDSQQQQQQQQQQDQPISSATPVQNQPSFVPYKIPEWSGPPCHKFYLEVHKDGSIVDQFNLCKKGAYMFGRLELCDFVLEHPTISRFHAVVQFKRSGDAYLYDVGSTHGTFINKRQVERRVYVDLHVGGVIHFGQSSQLYIFQGPPDLMPPEIDLKIIKESKIRQEMLDREESLRRARLDASLADGILWGMGEDAIEDAEDDDDEVTWQTYKGPLTEKQEKTREKVIKRTEKIAHMKREIDLIRAKDIAQGGLTQGQQTQIARNEQRIAQIMEELENLEETLNESIRESIGARAGRVSHSKKKGATEDDEDFLRTKKKPSIQKAGENQSIETVDTLLDKRDVFIKEIEEKKELLEKEKNILASEAAPETEPGDVLDAYMSGLSSQLVLDETKQLQKELLTLQSELDRILYLLKIADPMGEATKRRDVKAQEENFLKSEKPITDAKKNSRMEANKIDVSGKPVNVSIQREATPVTAMETNKKPETDKIVGDGNEGKTVTYTVVKPQWLGSVEDREKKETQQEEDVVNREETDQFIDYKDRQKMLNNTDDALHNGDSGIEAASGLIIRKKNQVENVDGVHNKALDQSTSSSAKTELNVEDAVALLLKT